MDILRDTRFASSETATSQRSSVQNTYAKTSYCSRIRCFPGYTHGLKPRYNIIFSDPTRTLPLKTYYSHEQNQPTILQAGRAQGHSLPANNTRPIGISTQAMHAQRDEKPVDPKWTPVSRHWRAGGGGVGG
jgi:hypothetical protein